jgi:hypothetical protein
VRVKPRRERVGGTLGQHVDEVGLHVDQDRAIAMPAAQREVIDPEHPHARRTGIRHGSDQAQQHVLADADRLGLGQTGAGAVADRQTDHLRQISSATDTPHDHGPRDVNMIGDTPKDHETEIKNSTSRNSRQSQFLMSLDTAPGRRAGTRALPERRRPRRVSAGLVAQSRPAGRPSARARRSRGSSWRRQNR